MCANYRPPKSEQFALLARGTPDFQFSEAYPGSLAPVLTNFDPGLWVPACFGLVPSWAKDAKLARNTYNVPSKFHDQCGHGHEVADIGDGCSFTELSGVETGG